MRDILIAVICLYFGATNVRRLAAIPLPQWEMVQWLLALVTLLLFALGIYMAWRVVRAMTVAQKRAKAEAARLRAEADAEARRAGGIAADAQSRDEAEDAEP